MIRKKRSIAFSLIELLCVMAVIFLMMALLIPAFSGTGSARALTSDGVRLGDLSNLARQNAMTKNALTALVVNTDPAFDSRYRALTIMELQPRPDGVPLTSADWKQVARWSTLQTGIVIDASNWPAPHSYSFNFNDSSQPASTPGVPSPPLPVLKMAGESVNSFSYAIFLPNGSLLSGSSAQLRLVEGFLPKTSDTVTYTHPDSVGRAANYYDIVILAATGRTKVNRP